MKASQAKAAVAPNQGRALLGREFLQHADQARAGLGRAVLFAGGDNDVKHQAQIAHPVGVQQGAGQNGVLESNTRGSQTIQGNR